MIRTTAVQQKDLLRIGDRYADGYDSKIQGGGGRAELHRDIGVMRQLFCGITCLQYLWQRHTVTEMLRAWV